MQNQVSIPNFYLKQQINHTWKDSPAKSIVKHLIYRSLNTTENAAATFLHFFYYILDGNRKKRVHILS